jgi:hypothetical protein
VRRFRLPSAGDILFALRDRLRGVRYFLADVGYLLGRLPRALRRGLGVTWDGLEAETRHRLAAAIGAAVALGALWAAAVPALPCEFPAGDECPPQDDAIEIVPAETLAYAHLSLDRDSDQYEQAAALAERLPLLAQQATGSLLARLQGPRGAPPDFERDLEPWLGDQAAIAVVPAGGAAFEQVQLLEAEDEDGAREYAEAIAAGIADTEEYRGVELSEDQRGLATAIVDGFLAIGRRDAIRGLIDVATGAEGAESLSESGAAESVRDLLPAERIVDAYLSREGAAELAAPAAATFASLEPFVAAGATRGAGASLSVTEDGLEVAVRSQLDPERLNADPSFFSAFPRFEPELAGELAPDALAYLGFGDPGDTAEDLLAQASAEAPGLAAGFGNLAERLRRLGKVDLERDLLPALGEEAAIAIEPKRAGSGEGTARGGAAERETTAPIPAPDEGVLPPGAGSPSPVAQPVTPYLSFVADGVDEERARRALARLQGPIANALDPGSGLQAPVFGRREFGDVQAQSLRLSPTVNLSYAVFDSKLVVATDPAGVEQVAGDDDGLDGSERFRSATGGLAGEPSLLAYLNLRDLVELGEGQGLADILGPYLEDVRQLEAFGLSVEADDESLSTDLRLVLGEPEEPAERGETPAREPAG